MVLDDLPADRQAEPRALGLSGQGGADLPEAVEDGVDLIKGDPHAAVLHLDHGQASRGEGPDVPISTAHGASRRAFRAGEARP